MDNDVHENPHLSRRRFIGAAGTVAAAGALGPLTTVAAADGGGWHGDDGDHGKHGSIPAGRIGIQLFTVRDLLADNELDLPGTFEMLADAGYAQVEIGGTYDGRTAAQFRALANQYGLRPEGMHTVGVGDLWRSDRAQIFADAAALGLRYVGLAAPIFGVLQTPPNITQTPQTHEAYKSLAAEFNVWGAEARRHGLTFYYHNHPFDFALDKGTPIYDTLLEETDPRLVSFEMDIAWFEAGGQSAYKYLRANPSRYPLFHVKDLRFADDGPRITPANVAQPNRPYWITDVGKGDIDFAKIFSALRDPSRHHYFVEHDDAPDDETPTGTSPRPRNPAGSANTAWTSRKYLASLQTRRRGWS